MMRRRSVLVLCIGMLLVSSGAGWARSWRAGTHHPMMYRYATPKDPTVAGVLSTVVPGMGQIYAGSPGKGMLFFFAEVTLVTAALVQIDRALYYDDLADTYDVFYDPHTDRYFSYQQGYNRARGYAFLGTGLLLAGAGMHLWNVQDAVRTAHRFNRYHRLTLEVKALPEPQVAWHLRF